MKSLVLKRIAIISHHDKSANQFYLKDGLNVITSQNNTSGKSTLIKLLFYTLGCEPEFRGTFKKLDCQSIVDVQIDNDSFTFYRNKKNFIIKSDSATKIFNGTTGEFSEYVSKLLNFNVLLQNRDNNKLETPPPAYYFTPYYIDQEHWKSPWTGFKYLAQYKDWQKDVINYHTGITGTSYFVVKKDLSIHNKNKSQYALENEKEQSTIETIKNFVNINCVVLNDIDFSNENILIVDKINLLSQKQSKFRNDFLLQQELYYSLLAERQRLKTIINELQNDYSFVVNNTVNDTIICPTCNTTHHNDIKQKANLLNNIDSLYDNLENLNSKIAKTSKTIKQLQIESNNIEHELVELHQAYSCKIGGNSLSEIIINSGKSSLLIQIENKHKITLEQIALNEIEIKKANKIIKEELNKEQIKIIKKAFPAIFNSYIKKLNLINELSSDEFNPCRINDIIGGKIYEVTDEDGAADIKRTFLACYLTIYKLAQKYGEQIIPPIVIDTPNQQDQSNTNYASILNCLSTLSSKQIIICVTNNNDDTKNFIAKCNNTIELNKDNKILNKSMYSSLLPEFNYYKELLHQQSDIVK